MEANFVEIHREKEASHLRGLRGRHQYSDRRSNQIKASCVISSAGGPWRRRTKWPDRQRKESS